MSLKDKHNERIPDVEFFVLELLPINYYWTMMMSHNLRMWHHQNSLNITLYPSTNMSKVLTSPEKVTVSIWKLEIVFIRVLEIQSEFLVLEIDQTSDQCQKSSFMAQVCRI